MARASEVRNGRRPGRGKKELSGRVVVAWDVETCPLPLGHLSEAQRRRYEKDLASLQRREPSLSGEEASRKARSLSGFLGWICCISAVRGRLDREQRRSSPAYEPVSFTAARPERERGMLEAFWETIRSFPGGTLWCTFNGKRFDVPFLTQRTAFHDLEPTRGDILDTYPYRHDPHIDLSWAWPGSYALDDLCGHLDVPSPKAELDGAGVWKAVEEGLIDDVAAYCERDVVATLRCARRLRHLLRR